MFQMCEKMQYSWSRGVYERNKNIKHWERLQERRRNCFFWEHIEVRTPIHQNKHGISEETPGQVKFL